MTLQIGKFVIAMILCISTIFIPLTMSLINLHIGIMTVTEKMHWHLRDFRRVHMLLTFMRIVQIVRFLNMVTKEILI